MSDDNDCLETSSLHRYKLIVAYNGTRYKGFQRQSSGRTPSVSHQKLEILNSTTETSEGTINQTHHQIHRKRCRDDKVQASKNKKEQVSTTIQEVLEDTLEFYTGLNRNDLRLRFAGRTDGGVHARGQVVAVSLPNSNDELWMIRRSINSRLPQDISIDDITSLADQPDFDPRKDTIRKRYSYTIKFRRKILDSTGNVLPLSMSGPNTIRCGLDSPTQWVCPWSLDDSKMKEYCQKLTGEHDYSAFVHKQSRRDKSNVLTVERFDYETLQHDANSDMAPVVVIQFHAVAKGFRRGMVRNLVGFVVDVCRGHVSESIFDSIWTGTDEVASMVHSAPPFGLCLENVEYAR